MSLLLTAQHLHCLHVKEQPALPADLDTNVRTEERCCRRHYEMVADALPNHAEEEKRPAIKSSTLKSNAFERLPDEIIEQ